MIFIHFKTVTLLGNPKKPLYLVEERYIDKNSIQVVVEMLDCLLLKILYACKVSFFNHCKH